MSSHPLRRSTSPRSLHSAESSQGPSSAEVDSPACPPHAVTKHMLPPAWHAHHRVTCLFLAQVSQCRSAQSHASLRHVHPHSVQQSLSTQKAATDSAVVCGQVRQHSSSGSEASSSDKGKAPMHVRDIVSHHVTLTDSSEVCSTISSPIGSTRPGSFISDRAADQPY